MIVVIGGSGSANGDHAGLVAFIHFHGELKPEVVSNVYIEGSGIVGFQECGRDVCGKCKRLLVVDFREENRSAAVGWPAAGVAEIVAFGVTGKS